MENENTNNNITNYDVIVIGAGVVGPCIATALARQGRKVLLIERNWNRPERIVGELLQPAGVKALVELGMVQAINNIEAIPCKGYWIKYHNESISLNYLDKEEAMVSNSVKPVPDCIFDGNDKLMSDSTINADKWYNEGRTHGVSFHNGDFLMNLRSIAKQETNITCLEGTATGLIRDDDQVVTGVKVKTEGGKPVNYHGKLTIGCDGIYSKFRKELYKNNSPAVDSYFVGLDLKDVELPLEYYGHVLIGNHAPVLAYRNSKNSARMLCAYRSTTPPSQKNNELTNYLTNDVLPALPECMKPSFENALALKKFKAMPNQYLTAWKQGKINKGLILLGDSLNMRHPLTGGGMTVGLNDAVILAKLLHPSHVKDLTDHKNLTKKLAQFHSKRKKIDAVINTLSIALYRLFAADTRFLIILQKGCFRYLGLGGAYSSGPIGLLSGMLPFPMLLFNHFFSVAFYALYWNFLEKGILGFPVALYDCFCTLVVASIVFLPYLWSELF